ncbi:hypothetical protein AX15_006228 [Amanita polypyramis BW_CC]|nr:hypothetical protein AX15_006228 [Amanita polypyramis BW_CC]
MDTQPDRVDTPLADWPLECLTTKLLTCLSTRQLKEIHREGAPALWESLHEGGFGSKYDYFNELCTYAFPLYQPLTADQAEQSVLDFGISMLEDAQKNPLKFPQAPEPEMPKGPKHTQHTTFAIPSGTNPRMDIDNPDFTRAQVNMQDRAIKFLNQGLNLITQLHQVMIQAAETQGDTPNQLIQALITSFDLRGKNTESFSQPATGVNPIQPNQQILQGTQGTMEPPTIHTPQPTRPIAIPMPPTRPSRPSTAAQGHTPYSPGKGKGRQHSKTPPSSKEASPCPSSCTYTSKAALSTKDTLARVQEIILKAPLLSIDDAMAIAKTLLFTPTPKPNS